MFKGVLTMDNNTFSEGIAPGGLRDRAEIKLLVCYLLKTLNKPLSRTQINEILQDRFHHLDRALHIRILIEDHLNDGFDIDLEIVQP